jgi:hypothetical protein
MIVRMQHAFAIVVGRDKLGITEDGCRMNTLHRRLVGCCWAAALASLLAPAGSISAQEDAVELGKEALSGAGRFPWYDRRQDDIRRLNTVPRKPLPNRGEQWTSRPAAPTAATPAAAPGRFNWFGPLLQWTGLSVLIILLGIIAYLVATSLLTEEVSETSAARRVVESRRDADRVEALPFQVRAARGDFLAEARRLYEAGRYSEAIVYLYSWQLVELDKHHVIRLAKGKTNRQYLRETRHRPALAWTLEITMLAFEDAFFGGKTLPREMFQRSWQRINDFQAELQRLEQAAA